MPEKQQPKNIVAHFIESLGNTMSQRIVNGVTAAMVVFIIATGKGMVKGVYAQGTREIMRPQIDSLQSQIDTVKATGAATAATVQKMQAAQLEMYSAQLQKDTALQRILMDRAANSRKAAEARNATEKLFRDLAEGAQ